MYKYIYIYMLHDLCEFMYVQFYLYTDAIVSDLWMDTLQQHCQVYRATIQPCIANRPYTYCTKLHVFWHVFRIPNVHP